MTINLNIYNISLIDCVGWPNGAVGIININELIIEMVAFRNCDSSKGGGLHINWASRVLIQTLIGDNVRAAFGGGIFASNIQQSFEVKNFSGKNIQVSDEGGVLYLNNVYLTILDHFSSINSGDEFKGSVFYFSSLAYLKLNNIHCENSSSGDEGGTLYFNIGILKLKDCVFIGLIWNFGGLSLDTDCRLYNHK